MFSHAGLPDLVPSTSLGNTKENRMVNKDLEIGQRSQLEIEAQNTKTWCKDNGTW